jgi:hypothetical protein
MTRFSVAPIPPEDRSLHWSNFVSGIFFPMRASFSAPERFHGTIENWQLGQISLSRFHSAPVCSIEQDSISVAVPKTIC